MSTDERKTDPPIAPPTGRLIVPPNAPDSGILAPLRETTPSPSTMSHTAEGHRPNNHAGTVGLSRLHRLVNERDVRILQSIAAHRLLLTHHVYDLHFWNHSSWASGIRACNRVLNRLREHRLLRRIDRPVGGHGGGSQGFVWAIDVAGERLLRDLDPRPRGRQRPFEPSTTFLAHTLAIADRRIEIEKAARAGRFELVSVVTEPTTWRQFPGELGKPIWLKPDLEVTTARGEWEHDWFIEVDLGTESGTALIRKCRMYQRYFATGREQARRGVFPRVLWLMPDQRRVDLLQRLLDAEREVPSGLFTVVAADRMIASLSFEEGGDDHAHDR